MAAKKDVTSVTSNRKVASTAPGLLLAHSWDEEQDMSGWWMSEKLDGVRAYWDGTRLLSRLGNEFFAPAWWLKGFPKEPLDGELWIGRGMFQTIVGTVKRHDGGDLWKQIKYLVFDAPGDYYGDYLRANGPLTFEKRLEYAARATLKAPVISLVKQTRCRDNHHLRCSLGEIIKQRGEGLMLRQPESLYVPKRSNTLLKVKTTQTAEGVVVGHEPGKGKHQGRMGALIVSLRPISASCQGIKLVNGPLMKLMQAKDDTVNVGTGFTDHERENPPKIGSVITYRFQELTDGGVPRFPAYVGIRRVS